MEFMISNDNMTIKELNEAIEEERRKNRTLKAQIAELKRDIETMQPKADYFDKLVERNLLTSLKETADRLNTTENDLIEFLVEIKYIYKTVEGKPMLFDYMENEGLFELIECLNEETGWSALQIFVTPRGRETFRLLMSSRKLKWRQ